MENLGSIETPRCVEVRGMPVFAKLVHKHAGVSEEEKRTCVVVTKRSASLANGGAVLSPASPGVIGSKLDGDSLMHGYTFANWRLGMVGIVNSFSTLHWN